jgi:hypothetical protein
MSAAWPYVEWLVMLDSFGIEMRVHASPQMHLLVDTNAR